MNVVLWLLQAVLAFLFASGGAFKIFQYEELAKVPSSAALSQGAWTAVGALEILGALLLIVPAAVKRLPVLTPIAAAVLAVESLAITAQHASYSTELGATNPMWWSLVMGLLAAFVAFGRFKLKPITR